MDRARESLRRNSCVLRYMCLQRYLWEMNSALYTVASAELTIVFTYSFDSNSTKLAPIALYTHCSQLVSAPSGYAIFKTAKRYTAGEDASVNRHILLHVIFSLTRRRRTPLWIDEIWRLDENEKWINCSTSDS